MGDGLKRGVDGPRGKGVSTPREEKALGRAKAAVQLQAFERDASVDRREHPAHVAQRLVGGCDSVLHRERQRRGIEGRNSRLSRPGLYCGFCKGTVYAREETEPNIDDATRRLWAAFSQEIAESPPRHWNAPMPERMMSQIRRPLGEILGPSAGRRMNMGVGVRHPGERKD